MAKTLYLVEDSPLLRNQIVKALEEGGQYHLVGAAARAEVAIEQIPTLRPSVIVVDLQLEQGSGWDVVDAVGDAAEHVVILSNHSSSPFRAAAQARRIRYFFDKSAEFDVFLHTLHQLA